MPYTGEPAKKRGVRERLEAFITHTATEIIVAILIVISVVLVVVEAATAPGSLTHIRVAWVNDFITVIFCVELLIRFFAERKKLRFFRRYWVDILAVVPLFRAFRFLRVLRLLRLFRVGIILGRHLAFFHRSFQFIRLEYVIIILSIVMAVLMGALSMRYAEGADNVAFDTFEETIWYASMTLVGGEPIGGEPQTPMGRMITLTLMMGGLTVFAIFAGTVSAIMVDSLRNLKFRHMEIDELEHHVVLCGWNSAGFLVLDELMHDPRFKEVVVIAEGVDLSETRLFKALPHRLYFLPGDCTRMDVLREAGIDRAACAVILADDTKEERSLQDRDARSVLAAMLIEKLNAEIYTTVQLMNRDNEASLRRVGVEEIIVSDEYVGNIMASVIRNRGIVTMLDELLTSKYGHQFFRCPCPAEYVGLTVADAVSKLKLEHNATLLAVDREGHPMNVNPPANLMLRESHLLVIAAEKPLA